MSQVQAPPEAADKPRVLIVDDERFNLNTLNGLLRDDYRIMVATHGEQGLKAALSGRPDLILLDITMPNMDGRDCLRKILEINPDARVIVASALHERTIVDLCLRLGAKCYVEKPMKFRDFAFCEGFRQAIASALPSLAARANSV